MDLLKLNTIKEIWVPDLYFTNEKVASFHDVTVPNKMLHLFSDGRVVYRLRYNKNRNMVDLGKPTSQQG